MGDIIHLECPVCDITREEFVGFGMAEKGYELCACYRCHRFVRKTIQWDSGLDSNEFRCPYCRRMITPVKNGDLCPVCDNPIVVEVQGIWD